MPPLRLRRRMSSVVLVAALTLPVWGAGPTALADDGTTAGDTVVGELVQAWPEHEDASQAAQEPLSWIATDSGDDVRVETADVDHLPVGATVEATVGGLVHDRASREQGLEPARNVLEAEVVAPPSPAPDAATTAPASPPYTDEVTVVLVSPSGLAPDGTDVNDVVATVNGPVANFWEQQSHGLIKIHASAGSAGWVTTAASCSDVTTMWSQAASAVGWTRAPGQHLLLYVPDYPEQMPSCSYGLAQIGPSRTWGGFLYVRDDATSVIAHELGHNFGLGHSSSRQCDAVVDGGTCRLTSYGDLYDVMGGSWEQVGSLNAVQAARIGLLPVDQQQAVAATDSGGTYQLVPVSASTGVRALRLTSAQNVAYWLEWRSPGGQDAWLSTAANRYSLETGVLLRRAGDVYDSSLLLDGTPSSRAGWDTDSRVALPVGTPVTVGAGDFSVTLQGIAGGVATVRVETTTMRTATAAIDAAYARAGGSTGLLGGATTEVTCGQPGGGCVRTYDHGEIDWARATGAYVLRREIRDAWVAAGGGAGALGFPVQDSQCGLARGGCGQLFQGGSLYWSPSTGAYGVFGGIREYWAQQRRELGELGYPTGAMSCDARGCRQSFEGGELAWSAATGTQVLTGALRDAWVTAGAGAGALGYPVRAAQCGLAGGGCGQLFQGGAVYWSPSTGAHALFGGIRQYWAQQRWELGGLGYPTGAMSCDATGCRQSFEGGELAWSAATGTQVLTGAVRDAWVTAGAGAGALGYPVRAPQCGLAGGGCGQLFQGGAVYWSPSTGAHALSGGIREYWAQQHWELGELGYPTGAMSCAAGTCTQTFEGGQLSLDTTTSLVTRS